MHVYIERGKEKQNDSYKYLCFYRIIRKFLLIFLSEWDIYSFGIRKISEHFMVSATHTYKNWIILKQ